jgi:hypothetical protein
LGIKTKGLVDTDPFLFYTFPMKNYLLLILSFISLNLFGQYTTTTVQTNTLSTSRMIFNYQTNKWDFVSNNDLTTFVSEWVFNITDENTGMITNGVVNYDILSYSKVDDAAYLKVYNVKAQRNMEIVIKRTDNGLGVVVFDKEQRISYYFFP